MRERKTADNIKAGQLFASNHGTAALNEIMCVFDPVSTKHDEKTANN